MKERISSVPGESEQPASQVVAPVDISGIDTMEAPALRNLIRTCYGVLAGFALLSDDEKAEAARLKLYSLGMTSNEVHKVVPALDKWFDRTAGKAPQSIAMTVKTPGIKQLSAMQILDARNMAARYLNVDPLLIAPEPTIIEND